MVSLAELAVGSLAELYPVSLAELPMVTMAELAVVTLPNYAWSHSPVCDPLKDALRDRAITCG